MSPGPAPIDPGTKIHPRTGAERTRAHTMQAQLAGGVSVATSPARVGQEQYDPETGELVESTPYPTTTANYGGSFRYLFRTRIGLEFGPVGYLSSGLGAGFGANIRYVIPTGDRFRLAPSVSGGTSWVDLTLPMALELSRSHWLHFHVGARYSMAGLSVPAFVGWRWQDPDGPFGVQIDLGGHYFDSSMGDGTSLLNSEADRYFVPMVSVNPTISF